MHNNKNNSIELSINHLTEAIKEISNKTDSCLQSYKTDRIQEQVIIKTIIESSSTLNQRQVILEETDRLGIEEINRRLRGRSDPYFKE